MLLIHIATNSNRPGADLTDRAVDALHEVELGVEWLRRAHGKLLEFRHNTGHAMEHLAKAERLLVEGGHDDPGDKIHDRHLPRGVVERDRWSYDVLESFEAEFMAEVTGFEERARTDLADGRRHVGERRQERAWKRQAEEEWPGWPGGDTERSVRAERG